MNLLDTYNSCKELIATNLNKRHIEASSDEGLTTLANKILLIPDYQEKSNGNIILTHIVDIPEELKDQVSTRGATVVIIGPPESSINLRISYSQFRDKKYIIENPTVGQYFVYCDALRFENPPLQSESILFAKGVLTKQNDLNLKTYVKY